MPGTPAPAVAAPATPALRAERRTARWTGAAYLGLAVTGMLGFLLLRPVVRESGAAMHALLGLELLIVICQAAAAVGFYALFRRDRPVEAFAVAVFGMANSAAILASAALLTAAAGLAPTAAGFSLLLDAADAFWSVGAVFFGLWLIPMGLFAMATARLPRILGGILVAGGIGYIGNALLAAAAPAAPGWLGEVLVIPASIGEFWTLGYLLTVGIRAPRD